MTDNTNVNQQPAGSPETQPGQQNATPTPAANDTPAWLPGRLNEERDAERRRVLKELGLEKFDDLKTVIAEHKKFKADSQSESERIAAALAETQGKLTAAETARQAAETKATELEAARIADRVDAAIKELCLTPAIRAEHPADVVELIRKGDMTGVIDDKGQVVPEKVKALVEQAKKDRPGWFKTGGVGSPSNRDGVAPEALAAEKEKARRAQAENLRHKF
jgi:hypothetical protein